MTNRTDIVAFIGTGYAIAITVGVMVDLIVRLLTSW